METARAGDFVFAQPRLQARHAAMPGPGVWSELEQIADFGQFLQSVRSTSLGSAVDGFGASSTIDDMEIALRCACATRIEEMAAWLPEDWQPAMRFIRILLWLPFCGYAGAPDAPGWMAADPELAEAWAARHEEERQDSGAAPDAEAWRGRWRALWPRDVPGLAEIGRLLVAAALPGPGGGAPWPERRAQLAESLRRAFRRHAFGPGAAFAQAGLLCLEFGRLRGNLSARKADLIG